jgi:hypothetical protein
MINEPMGGTGITYNSNTLNPVKTKIYDSIKDPGIDTSKMFSNLRYLKIPKNYTIIDINDSYKHRMDLVSREQYGNDMYGPLLLIVNNIGSMFNFDPEKLNYKLKVPTQNAIDTYVSVKE